MVMSKLDNRITDTHKPLPPLLYEFRTALQDEIEVAKRNASTSAIPLTNGHKVGQQGSAFQYAFLIDSVLNTPDGAPGDLVIPGRAPMEVTIVSAEGLRLVISVETDLGKFVPSARLQTNLTILMRKLIGRIENNASASNPAASRMLGTSPVSGSPMRPEETLRLNDSQMRALESALGRNLTVIWGPPGTGKTHTIGTIAQCLHGRARTVLIVSHTNTAVDQAIKHVAAAMPEHLEQGAVIRVGQVKDDELRSKYPDVLLKRQVERQSRELVELRDNLLSQKQALGEEMESVKQKISIIEWIEASRGDIESSTNRLEELCRQQEQLKAAETSLAESEDEHPQLLELHKRTSRIIALQRKLAFQREEKSRLEGLLSQNASEWEDANHRVQQQDTRLETAERITPLREERATYPSPAEQKSVIETLSARMVETEQQLKATQRSYDDANSILEQARRTGAVMRMWKRLPKPEEQQIVVSDFHKKVTTFDAELAAAQTAYHGAGAKLVRILELDGELTQYETIGTYSEELEEHRRTQHTLQCIVERGTELESDIERICSETERLESEEKLQAATFDGDVEELHVEVCSRLRQFKELQDSVKTLRSQTRGLRQSISSMISPFLDQLLEWEVISHVPSEIGEMLDLARQAHQKLSAQHSASDLSTLKEKVNSLRTEIQRIASEVFHIDERLAKVERDIISNASIVGATLTKTYLSDDIQARKFDTVILDEASMAPIPALWAAALLSKNSLIIVGDFKQLPPIVLSKNDLTKRWLGRDIFDASGLKKLWEKGTPPEHFVQLNEQRRMLPEIADVANVFYDGLLRTSPEPPKGLEEFRDWYDADWPHDSPVVLVDTGTLNAWVTSVVRGGNSSRLNFLSATVAVDLAEQLLLPDRTQPTEGAPKRILIVAPYRPHAKLVSILLRENAQLQDEVISGTIHSFQGSEADAVIFDLVVDEPHFKRVNLFTPSWDDQIKRLMNVGLTRAKFRLFVLGDFTYCQSHAKKAFLGKELLPFLIKSFPRIDASRLFPDGLAARATKAQMTMLGGEIEPDSERIVVTQADFFRIVSTDFSRANSRIIIYSPFITQDRLSFLMPQLQAASLRDVAVFIITKSHAERSKSEFPQIRRMEGQLSEIGVIVMHKMRMHEKLVFIDDDITWSGSLNPLSFSNTQEVMERRKSKAVLDDYFQILRLQELLAVHGNAESKCPICGSEIIAAEGPKQPYYWRCINDGCYTRSIDQAYPFDGVLTCGNCNKPVEFGYWGDYPHWRCTANKRHRQKIFKSHLRLPKMAALIPERERRKVCKAFGIADFGQHIGRSERATPKSSEQFGLFDDLK